MSETMSSDHARSNWGDLITSAMRGKTTIIERYSKPLAVIVSYEEWQKIHQQLRVMKANKALQLNEFVTDQELEAGLQKRGLL